MVPAIRIVTVKTDRGSGLYGNSTLWVCVYVYEVVLLLMRLYHHASHHAAAAGAATAAAGGVGVLYPRQPLCTVVILLLYILP